MAENALLEKMLKLPEFNITDLKDNEEDIRIYVSMKEKPTVCSLCGVFEPKLRVHGSREQEIRDKNILGKRLGLMINRKRYKCMECGGTFMEDIECIDDKRRMTKRFRAFIAEEAKRKSFIDIHRETAISDVTIREIFLDEVKDKLKSGQEIETPNFIGIDEIYVQREGKNRKQAWGVICNGDDRTVMDMLPNRNKPTIIEYLKNLKSPWQVEIVTMDMWEAYRDAVYEALPNAVVVVDKFHVVKMANKALDDYRKSLKGELGKRNIKLKKERYLVLSRPHKLNFTGKVYRDAWFSEFPELKTVYELKEALFNIYTAETKKEALKLFDEVKKSIPKDITVFDETIKSIDNWEKEIFNYFDYPVTNAFVEGSNSTIRFIEKQGRGYDFEVLRAKVMFCIGHKIETTKYGTNTFSKMTYGSFNIYGNNEEQDYGVPFENIIKAINEGLI